MTKYFAIGVLFLILVLIVVFRDKLKALLPGSSAATPQNPANPTQPVQPVTPQTPAQLDLNKVLKKGVNGGETKVLQQYIGATADGIFGQHTEDALKAKKGVIETTLAQYQNLPDVNAVANNTADGSHWYDGIPYAYIFN